MEVTEGLFAAIRSCPMPLNLATWPAEARDRISRLHAEETSAAVAGIRAALDAGAQWQAPHGPGDRDAAFSAAICASAEPLELLLDHGVPIDHRGNDGWLIHRAAAFGAVDVIDLLVARGTAVDQLDQYGRTPLQVARASQHGAMVIPHLIGLMREHGCPPAPARRSDDIRPDAVADRTLTPQLAALLEAFFIERAGVTSSALLTAALEARDPSTLSEAVLLVREVSTAVPKAKTIKPRKGAVLVHHGDLHVSGDISVSGVAVTGDLSVDGCLNHFQGGQVAVGGDLRADAVWSEGTLFVGGDLVATRVFACATNDYGATVLGALTSPVLAQLDDHHIAAGSRAIGVTITDRGRLPDEAAEALRL